VTVVSAPAGSGKTVLLRSWIGQAGLDGHIAWVAAGWEDREPGRLWLSVVDALRRTVPGAKLVQALTAAPDLDGWPIVERLLKDLAPLDEPVWLVIDDVHELGREALRQLELLIMRAPPRLRYVLATRHDVRLGLHRLRLEGGLTEIRTDDLRFGMDEADELFTAAGVRLPASAVALLVDRTEGWAAGLRLAALSLAGHPDPERFAAGFSGTDRTVAEYLLAEVLDRQPETVRRLLLRTSLLDRVNGELAGLLTGDTGGEAALQDLEEANAFVVSLDPERSWFRYHPMFATLLQLELRRTAPAEVTALHRTAANWLEQHGYPVEAIRHAQAARDWDRAARLLADHWPSLYLDGQAAATHQLLAQFPPAALAADAELASVAAADQLAHGSLETAGLYLGLAEQKAAAVPAGRQGQLRLLLGIVGLLLARQRVDPSAVAGQGRRLQAMAETRDAAQPGLGDDLRALALISLGTTEYWTAKFEDAERHLEHGVTLARMIGRPFLEFSGLAYQAAAGIYRSFALAGERSMQAFELARAHGWTDEPAAGTACMVLGGVLAWQARHEEAEPWVQLAERTLSADAEPAAGMGVRYVRGLLELARGRDTDALAALRAAKVLAGRLATPHYLVPRTWALLLHALVRLGDAESAERTLATLSEQDLEAGETRLAIAALRLAQHDPRAATAALAPVLDGSAPRARSTLPAHAFILEAIARDALGDSGAAESALERALDLAEPNGELLPFLLNPVPVLLERHSGHRGTHASLIADIQSLLAGNGSAPSAAGPQPLSEPLRESEIRVLRYLPTNLSVPEIASELYISPNTVKTHIRNLYAKLGANRRAGAVARARELGLLAPSGHIR
jgi:LuxR family maltose regulon positive regulatory protein